MSVSIACKLGTAPLDTPVGLADLGENAAKPGLETPWHPAAAPGEGHLAGFAVSDGLVDASDDPALRCHSVEGREAGMVDGAGRLDQLLAQVIGS